MSAYLLYLCKGVDDRRELEEYWAGIGETLSAVGAQNLAAYTRFEVLEGGDDIEGVVLTEFPSVEVAKQWYDSPAYVALREHRFRGARYVGMLIDGGWLPPSDRMTQTKNNTRHHEGPQPTGVVADFFFAALNFDPGVLGDVFHKDALLDHQHTQFHGRSEIRDWARREIVGNKLTVEITDVKDHHGDQIVTGLVSSSRGDAEPTKEERQFYFSVRDDRISQLVILPSPAPRSVPNPTERGTL